MFSPVVLNAGTGP